MSWSSIAKTIWLSNHLRNFWRSCDCMSINPPVCLHQRATKIAKWISHFLASVGACLLILYIHVVVFWQLSKQCIYWPVSHDCVTGSGFRPFFSIYPLTSHLVFNDSQVQLREVDFFEMATSLFFKKTKRFRHYADKQQL